MGAFPPAVASHLRALGHRGTFEAHLTVDGDGAGFAAACDALGVKCVVIALARGAHPQQPMTSTRHAGALADAVDAIDALHARVEAAGFRIVRVKVEADADDAVVVPGGYFELHAKLARVDEAVRAACAAAGAHLSRNEREPGVRFATLRAPTREPLAPFVAALGDAAIAVKAEYALYDDRVELDAGWLP